MKIGILQTGRSPDSIREKHGDYDEFFKRYLAGRGFTFDTFAVLDGTLPNAPQSADGWLITGSRFGAYEDHDWIPPLEEFLREIFAVGCLSLEFALATRSWRKPLAVRSKSLTADGRLAQRHTEAASLANRK